MANFSDNAIMERARGDFGDLTEKAATLLPQKTGVQFSR